MVTRQSALRMPETVLVWVGTVLRGVVLRAAHHMIERFVVVDVDLVELSQRQIGSELVGLGIVPGSIDTAVTSDQQEIGIGGVERDRVVVDMLVRVSDTLESRSAIDCATQLHVGVIEDIEAMWITVDFLVVVRARCRPPRSHSSSSNWHRHPLNAIHLPCGRPTRSPRRGRPDC